MTLTQTVSKPIVVEKFPIESLLSARLMMELKVAGDKVYFLSDLNGSLSLYSIEKSGSIPNPLLPHCQGLVNPHLINGENFVVLPGMGKVLIMMDKLGNENYQPCFVPLDGVTPDAILGERFKDEEVACVRCDTAQNIAYYYQDHETVPAHGV